MKVGIVVPTLGDRPDMILAALSSIRRAGEAWIIIVGPSGTVTSLDLPSGMFDAIVDEKGKGAASAIQQGLDAMPDSVELVGWLGDDDLLEPQALTRSSREFQKDSHVVATYGRCNYIDSTGAILGCNRSGRWATWLARFGPDLMPQPGSLFRREAVIKVGGLDRDLGWAFDLDLFLKLMAAGKVMFVPQVLANFRWHKDSLTVRARDRSIAESRIVRERHLPSGIQRFSMLWESPLCALSRFAGNRLSTRLEHMSDGTV